MAGVGKSGITCEPWSSRAVRHKYVWISVIRMASASLRNGLIKPDYHESCGDEAAWLNDTINGFELESTAMANRADCRDGDLADIAITHWGLSSTI